MQLVVWHEKCKIYTSFYFLSYGEDHRWGAKKTKPPFKAIINIFVNA